MKIRLAYLKRGSVGDGIELAGSFSVYVLPRIGDCVLLPEDMCERIADCDTRRKDDGFPINTPSFPVRRFEVVNIDHDWNQFEQPISVYVALMSESNNGPV
jgi:hypothetical protein